MSKSNKPEAEKAKNYSAEQEAAIIAAAPLNLEKAKELAETFGKSWRSVVAKAANLGVEYTAKAKPAKRPAKVTKSELVEEISARIGGVGLAGLEKATLRALVDLRDALPDAD